MLDIVWFNFLIENFRSIEALTFVDNHEILRSFPHDRLVEGLSLARWIDAVVYWREFNIDEVYPVLMQLVPDLF